MIDDHLTHAVKVLKNIPVCESQKLNAQCFDVPLSRIIVIFRAFYKMTISVHFNGQLQLGTIEIQNIPINAVLPQESAAEKIFRLSACQRITSARVMLFRSVRRVSFISVRLNILVISFHSTNPSHSPPLQRGVSEGFSN